MRCRNVIAAGWGFLTLIVAAGPTAAAPWTATQSGYWTNAATWGGGGTPGAGDDATINSGVTVTADVSTASLASFTDDGTLVFVGTNTPLNAGTVVINGTVTHLPQSAATTNPSGQWIADNRVWIVCSNLTVEAGKTIDVSGKGYTSRVDSANYSGCGPGGGGRGSPGVRGGGGGYGGVGGTQGSSAGGRTYGSVTTPEDPGSGGGGESTYQGGWGGGAVRIDASGKVTLNGTIAANGTTRGQFASGGSGGGILIYCDTFAGSNGTVRSDGGAGGGGRNAVNDPACSGAGGRIAIHYNPSSQSNQNLTAPPTVRLSAAGGLYSAILVPFRGEPGTIYVSDTSFYPPEVLAGAQLPSSIPGFTSWAPSRLVVSNVWVELQTGFTVSVTNDIVVREAGGRLDVRNTSLQCGGNLVLTNGALLYAFAGPTNDIEMINYGACVNVGDTLVVPSGSIVYPCSDPTNGGSVRFTAKNIRIDAGGGLNANARGYASSAARGYGPGGGPGGGDNRGTGGGYGGDGGRSVSHNDHGYAYGSSNLPVQCGSGGGGNNASSIGGAGGGLVWIEALTTVTLNGTLTANAGAPGTYASGGAGGGIYIRCKTLSGTGGTMTANGSNGGVGNRHVAPYTRDGGGGGGGRIAVWRVRHDWTGTATVDAGLGWSNGVPGTIVWGNIAAPGTVIMVK